MEKNPDGELVAESTIDQGAEPESASPGAGSIEDAPVIIAVKWTKQARIAKTQAHLGAGAGLLALGLTGLLGGAHHILMPLISTLVAGSYLAFAVREFLHIRRDAHAHSRIGWLHVFAGLVVFVEAYERLRPGRVFQAATCMMVPAFALIAVGLFEGRLGRAFRLEISGTGFKLRLRPIRLASFRWVDLADLRVSGNGKRLALFLKDGRRKHISFRRVANRDEMCQAITERFRGFSQV
jgi:hypothetical protein